MLGNCPAGQDWQGSETHSNQHDALWDFQADLAERLVGW